MFRRRHLALALLLLATLAFGMKPAAAADEGSVVLTQAPQPAPPPLTNDWLANIRAQHVIAIGVGALAGDLLHGAIGLSGPASLVVGGVLGYYVYVNYFENPQGPTARRINAVADDTKLYLIAAKDSLLQLSGEFWGAR